MYSSILPHLLSRDLIATLYPSIRLMHPLCELTIPHYDRIPNQPQYIIVHPWSSTPSLLWTTATSLHIPPMQIPITQSLPFHYLTHSSHVVLCKSLYILQLMKQFWINHVMEKKMFYLQNFCIFIHLFFITLHLL